MDDPAHRVVVPTSSYSYRPPSPPLINICVHSRTNNQISLKPSYDRVDPRQISRDDFPIITGYRAQTSVDHASSWRYEQRREAQPILDFLYLGPTSVIRDLDFLRREGFDMVIIARDSRATMKLASVDTAAATLGIRVRYIDIVPSRMVDAFYAVVREVNDHLVARHQHPPWQDEVNIKRGKILVTCDSGNDLAPPLAVAYIMSVFGQDMMTALHFVLVQRFCSNFCEETKRALLTWEGIIKAGSTVARHSHNHTSKENTKRGLDEMMDATEEDAGMSGLDSTDDHERFQDREAFVPFVELEYDGSSIRSEGGEPRMGTGPST